MEIHQKKAGPDYHILMTMVKRSIEQNLRMMNFEARNGNYETSAVVKNQGTKQRVQRNLGDCWQWKTNGQCIKGDNCSSRHDISKRAQSTQPNPSPSSSTRQNVKNASRTRSPRGRSQSGRMARLPCKDYLKRTCTNDHHQRNPGAPKFEDRSQEETEWQEQGAREAAGKLAKNVLKLKEQERATFFSPSENWCLPAPSNLKPEEREFVVDSRASMHMISKKDLNSAEGKL